MSLLLGNLADEKDFLQKLPKLRPSEWHRVVSLLKEELNNPENIEQIQSGVCSTPSFSAVRNYLGEEKEGEEGREKQLERKQEKEGIPNFELVAYSRFTFAFQYHRNRQIPFSSISHRDL